jgi:hypothetical protein
VTLLQKESEVVSKESSRNCKRYGVLHVWGITMFTRAEDKLEHLFAEKDSDSEQRKVSGSPAQASAPGSTIRGGTPI